ncbi:MAG: DMT family transporter, partial [Psychromonas sp.]
MTICTATDKPIVADLKKVTALSSNSLQQQLGIIAALLTVFIWSTYFLSLRSSALSPLSITELALFRFAIPGILLLPLFIKRWEKIRKVPLPYLLAMMTCAGLPFFLLSGSAMGIASVAYGSTLLPGVAPLFVTLIAVVIFKQPFEIFKKIGLTVIILGVLFLLASNWQSFDIEQSKGQIMLLAASLLWAIFTVAVRLSGLKPLEAAAVVALPSAVAIVVYICLTGSADLGYSQISIKELLLHMLVQGIGVGLLASYFYGYAISKLGAELTSAIGSLTPVLASLWALFLFSEQLNGTTITGMIFTVLGVIIASGMLKNIEISNKK